MPMVWLGLAALATLIWTWVLYPLVIWLLARIVRVPDAALPPVVPTVTAILATRDDLSTVVARVADFFAADYPPDRLAAVVGVDAASTETLDSLRAACSSYPVTIVAADPEGGKGAGLNAAVRHADGDILVFSDAQQRFAPDAIRRLVARLSSDSRWAAVGGALQLPGDRNESTGRSPVEWYWWMERELRAAEARLHSSVGVSGSIYAMWRRDWVPMPAQLILDDVWLPMRLILSGRRVGYELAAMAWDARATNAVQERVRKVRTLTGNFQLVAWLPAVLLPVRNPIWLQFISHKLLRLLTPWLIMLVALSSAVVLPDVLPPDVLRPVLASAAAAAVCVLLIPRLRGLVMRTAEWVWSLQTAVVEATVNGVRGRWDVWR